MNCWYIYGLACDRPPGICEGCDAYAEFVKSRDDLEKRMEWLVKNHPEVKEWAEHIRSREKEEEE